MTREDIIAQARVGGFAVVRLEVKEVLNHESYQNPLIVCGQYDNHGLFVNCNDVISIEQPPKSDAEKLADALAEIERLKAELAGIVAEKSIYPSDPNPWRDHDGGDMPCDEDLNVDVQYRDNIINQRMMAGLVCWAAVKRWRPHVEVG